MRLLPVALAFLSAPLLVATPAGANGIRIVSTTGGPSFTTLQSAVDAAVDGDVILVGGGSYFGAVVIDDKSLWIVAPPVGEVAVTGLIAVRNLSAGKAVFVSGIGTTSNLGLDLQNNAGPVWLQFCTFRASQGGPATACNGSNEVFPVARITNSSEVALFGCSITGGEGGSAIAVLPPAIGGDGGTALSIVSSNVALHDTVLLGGKAGETEGCSSGPTAGDGCTVTGTGTAYLAGCTIRGGDGFDGLGTSTCGGPGGRGLVIGAGTPVHLATNTLLPSEGGHGFHPGMCNGPGGQGLVDNGAQLSIHAFQRPLFFGSTVHAGPLAYTVEVHGDPGDATSVVRASRPRWSFVPAADSVRLLPEIVPHAYPPATIPPSGELLLDVGFAALPAGVGWRTAYAQGVVRDPIGGGWHFGNGLGVLELAPGSGPDCDGNGVNDFVDVVFDPLADTNHNLVPDACPGG